MSFTVKKIDVDLNLAKGNFSSSVGGNGNNLHLSGLRVSCKIHKVGGPAQGTADIAIYGLPLSTMNQMTTFGTQLGVVGQNKVTVSAGDDETGMAVVFMGTVQFAYMDGQAMPKVPFRIRALGASYEAVKQVDPISVAGSADVNTLFSKTADSMGMTYEGHGITQKLDNPYHGRSGLEQAVEIGQHAGVGVFVDDGKLVALAPGQARNTSPITIAPPILVGYPSFNSEGIILRTQYIPPPGVQLGNNVIVQSSITPACGTWLINNLIYELESLVLHGAWYCSMKGNLNGYGGGGPPA